MSESMEQYINQRNREEELFASLQKDSIDMLQQLSGGVWTDFNAHDPGITILDVLNYALTELDYKQRFPLVDYLTVKGKPFRPEDVWLFRPDQVFPVNPVTVEDYRKLFLMHVPELENVWIDINTVTGGYSIHLEVFEFMKEVIAEEVRRKVEKLFMAHRNLGETLESIDFVKLENVWLEGEIELLPGTGVTAALVEVYHKAYAYLARHVRYDNPETMQQKGIAPDEWLDGPNDTDIRIITVGKDEVRTETGLYHLLRQIHGIKSVHSFYIRRQDGQLINRFESPYRLLIPRNLTDLKRCLRVTVDGIPVAVRFEHFLSEFDVSCMNSGNYLRVRPARRFTVDTPVGTWHPVFSHDSVLNDFPDNYGINQNGLPGFADKGRRAKSMQLKAYLSLFDFVFTRGLKELDELKRVMQPGDCLEYPVFSARDFETLYPEGILQETDGTECFASRDILALKGCFSDMLDGIYGEDSCPVWLDEYNYYDDTEAVRLAQRVRFLEKVPLWGRDRFRACDLSAGQDGINIPGVKAYVSALFDWSPDEGRAVGNVFAAYNLNYIRRDEYEQQLSRMLKSDLIQEQMLSQYNMEPVPVLSGPYTVEDYEDMRMVLPYFYNNLLHDELFRGGIYLENLKIVHMNPSESLLVFRNRERKVWMTLGRSPDRNKLGRMANVLRSFLLKLNRECEAMYVVENQYFDPPEYFSLTIVLPGWSARMADLRFREICRKLILSRLPVHLKADFHWLDIDAIQKFEIAWRQWRQCMQQENHTEAVVAMKEIQMMFKGVFI